MRLYLWWTNALQGYRDINEEQTKDMLQAIEDFISIQTFSSRQLTNIVFDVMMMFKEEDDDGITKSLGQSLNLIDYGDYRTERIIKHLKRKCKRLKLIYELLLRVFKHKSYKKRWNKLQIGININFKHSLLTTTNIFDQKEELMWKKLIINNMLYYEKELKILLQCIRKDACIYRNAVFKLSYNVGYDLLKDNVQFNNFINSIKLKNDSKIHVFGNYNDSQRTTIQIPLP